MSALLQLGSTPINLKDEEFSNGFQIGYLHFKKGFQGTPITDELLYTVIAQTFVDVRRTNRCNAGYLVGFISALMEKQPEQSIQITRILPFARPQTEVQV